MKKFLWVEEYSPQTVKDCILPDRIKETFLEYAKTKEFPNLLLAGPAGVGKTSVAKALCEEIDADLLFVNASLDRGIGDVRTTVAQFASTSSMYGGLKVVLLDEADNLTADSQKALRALIEEFQNHCRFILTCNYPHNIIDAIHSRCTVFDFHVRDQKDVKKLSAEFGMRCVNILKENEVKFDPKLLLRFVMSMAPDWRGAMNTLQGKTKNGVLEETILAEAPDALIEFLKAKRWKQSQEWIFKHSYLHPKYLEGALYKSLQEKLTDESKPQIVLLFAEYSDKIMNGADPCITLVALATQIMMEADWK